MIRYWAAPAVFGVLVLGAWQAICTGLHVPVILLPPPSQIAAAISSHVPLLWADFVQTVLRAVVPGYLLGGATGLLAAILLDVSPFLRRGFMPYSQFAAAMPIVGVAPIMVMWFGFDWQSKAAVVVVLTFFPMLLQASEGLLQAGAMERDLMRSYAASRWQTLVKLRLPAALPFIFTALKLNASLALIGAIVAEYFGTPVVGMGFRISTEVQRMNLDLVWAEITLAACCGCVSFAALSLAERLVIFWHPTMRT